MKKMVVMMMAVMAVIMAGCSDTSVAEIQPIAEATIESEPEKEIVEVEKVVYVEVEKEKETPILEGIFKITDSIGAVKRFMILTDQGYFVAEYLPDAIELINKTCKRDLKISDAFGRFQVSDETGRAVFVQQLIEVE